MTLNWSSQYAPVDADFSDVSLLLLGEGTNGSTTITDSSSSPKAVTAAGNTQISTAQSKFGGSSIVFPGVAGDHLTLATSSDLALGTTFTIEFWAYFNNVASYKAGFISPDVSPFSGAGKLGFYLEGVGASQTFRYSFGGVVGTSSAGLLTSNTWYHVAFVCNNQTVTVYLMGSRIIGPTFNAAFDHTAQPQRIGEIVQFSGYNLNGYISNLRITKGVARYTENFDVPTAPFPILSPSGRVTIADDSLDADARQYIINVEEQDGEALEDSVRTAINDFVVGCKSDGIWNAIKSSCIMAGARTLDGALVPLKGTAPTNYNFVAGDYNRKTGLVGDSSTKYLDSNRSNSADPQNNAHISIYQTVQNTTGGSRLLMGSRTSIAGLRTTQINTTSLNNWSVQIRNNNPQNFTGSISGEQFVGGTRSSSTNETRRDGGVSTTYATTSLATVNFNHFVFCGNQDGSPIAYSNARLAFYSIGESLDLALLDNRISTLMTTLDTVLP